MENIKAFFKSLDKDKLKKVVKTNSFTLVMLLFCFPVGIVLMWKSNNFRKEVKIISTVVGTIWLSLFIMYVSEASSYEKMYNDLDYRHVVLKSEKETLEAEKNKLEETEVEYLDYKEKMAPYESLSEADRKKRENDGKISQKVTEEISKLPAVASMTLNDKSKFQQVKEHYDKLSKEQKELVDSSIFSEYEEKIKQLEVADKKKKEDEQKQAEAAKRKAEEEAKGFETGITYDQLARTPDDYLAKKVKFSGKVIQVMEGDDSTQIRLAVDGNYDTVLYAEYQSSSVSSRVLEDDYITVYGVSSGLLSYKSTMGGTITIPSVLVSKIDQ